MHAQSDFSIHEFLKQRNCIAIIWSIEDVKEQRPDLTDAQAWEVLQSCRQNHDCNYGLTWEHIDSTAEQLVPSPDD